jgi:hypothetical protein
LSATPTSQPTITLDRQPPTVERFTFDPANRPDDMPKLQPNEDAVCQFDFQCGAQFKSITESQRDVSSGVEVTVRIETMSITLTLVNRIWLPRNATAKLRTHEEGHRIINERIYESAGEIAEEIARRIVEQPWTATGETVELASSNALRSALRAFCKEYHERVADRAYRIGVIYDELTRHGRRMRPTEAEAIDMAFERESRERTRQHPDTD